MAYEANSPYAPGLGFGPAWLRKAAKKAFGVVRGVVTGGGQPVQAGPVIIRVPAMEQSRAPEPAPGGGLSTPMIIGGVALLGLAVFALSRRGRGR
jgi:MYXO-CTERM domain-containing protein